MERRAFAYRFHSSKQCCGLTLLRTLLVCSERVFFLGAEIFQVKVSLHFFSVSGFSWMRRYIDVRLARPVSLSHLHSTSTHTANAHYTTRRIFEEKKNRRRRFWGKQYFNLTEPERIQFVCCIAKLHETSNKKKYQFVSDSTHSVFVRHQIILLQLTTMQPWRIYHLPLGPGTLDSSKI